MASCAATTDENFPEEAVAILAKAYEARNGDLLCLQLANRVNEYMHSFVASTKSPLLQKVVTNTDERVISLIDFEIETVQALIKYCYTGKLLVTQENDEEMGRLGARLGIAYVVQKAGESVLHHSNEQDFFQLVRWASDLNLTSFITDLLIKYKTTCNEIIVNEEHTKKLNAKLMKALVNLSTLETDEDSLFALVERWMDTENAKPLTHDNRKDLYGAIDLNLLTQKGLRAVLHNSFIHGAMKDFMDEAMNYLSTAKQEPISRNQVIKQKEAEEKAAAEAKAKEDEKAAAEAKAKEDEKAAAED